MTIKERIQQIEDALLQWEGMTALPHPRFGGRQFDWNGKEIGHIHWNGDLDILFNKALHDTLISEGQAVEHKWVPGTGWITLPLLEDADISSGMALLQLSYYQKRRRAERDKDFSAAVAALPFSDVVKSLL